MNFVCISHFWLVYTNPINLAKIDVLDRTNRDRNPALERNVTVRNGPDRGVNLKVFAAFGLEDDMNLPVVGITKCQGFVERPLTLFAVKVEAQHLLVCKMDVADVFFPDLGGS